MSRSLDCFLRPVQILCFILVLTNGCTPLIEIASGVSPNGHFRVVVTERKYFPVDSSVFVDLVEPTPKRIGRTHDEFDPGIVQMVWSDDSKLFGIVVFDTGGGNLSLAYDVEDDHPIDFAIVAPRVREALVERFHLEGEIARNALFDPINWVGKRVFSQELLGH